MQDNTKLGKRTLFWMKAAFIWALISAVLGLILVLTNDVQALMNAAPEVPVPTGAMVLIVAIAIGCLVFGIGAAVAGIFWLFWLFRTTKNLRKVTTTKFSPWAAVICTCIPYLGYLLDFIIFRDLTKKQQCYLRSIGVDFPPVNLFLVNGWFLLSVLSGVVQIFGDSTMILGLSIAFALLGFYLFIQAFKPYIMQEWMLFARYEEDRVREFEAQR